MATLNLDLFRAETLAPPAPATIHTRIAEEAGATTAAIASLDNPTPDNKTVSLPDIDELQSRFDRFNWMYFEGKLPRVRIEYSSRMTSAGAWFPGRHLIRIGRKYHELFPEELSDTLKHEMIHLLHVNHGAVFKAEARRIGASVRARSHPKLRRPPRYIYSCPVCQAEYPRQKRLVMASCGSCSPGRRFHQRFKLVLIKSFKVER